LNGSIVALIPHTYVWGITNEQVQNSTQGIQVSIASTAAATPLAREAQDADLLWTHLIFIRGWQGGWLTGITRVPCARAVGSD
jgi:hypothetical protein